MLLNSVGESKADVHGVKGTGEKMVDVTVGFRSVVLHVRYVWDAGGVR